ncbi:MAG: hypothetical protein J0I75_10905 [Hyphomicrobium sp.]|nr:hypothetical protein [Hyphomicrobium sp.]
MKFIGAITAPLRALLRLAETNEQAALPIFGRNALMTFHASQQSCAI